MNRILQQTGRRHHSKSALSSFHAVSRPYKHVHVVTKLKLLHHTPEPHVLDPAYGAKSSGDVHKPWSTDQILHSAPLAALCVQVVDNWSNLSNVLPTDPPKSQDKAVFPSLANMDFMVKVSLSIVKNCMVLILLCDAAIFATLSTSTSACNAAHIQYF
jgi:hypothetical protein